MDVMQACSFLDARMCGPFSSHHGRQRGRAAEGHIARATHGPEQMSHLSGRLVLANAASEKLAMQMVSGSSRATSKGVPALTLAASSRPRTARRACNAQHMRCQIFSDRSHPSKKPARMLLEGAHRNSMPEERSITEPVDKAIGRCDRQESHVGCCEIRVLQARRHDVLNGANVELYGRQIGQDWVAGLDGHTNTAEAAAVLSDKVPAAPIKGALSDARKSWSHQASAHQHASPLLL
jgi:hypothetical protein